MYVGSRGLCDPADTDGVSDRAAAASGGVLRQRLEFGVNRPRPISLLGKTSQVDVNML